jgi:type IV secretory pathway VirB10-like protein
MKKDLNDVIEKYNNGELSIVEVAVAYKSAKKFANIVGEYLPTASELNSTYRSVKNKLNYLRGWVSSRLRSGDSITEIQNLPPPPPPPPPPSPSPDPPPPPQEPEPEPEPEPELNQEQDQSTMYDTARQTIENLYSTISSRNYIEL